MDAYEEESYLRALDMRASTGDQDAQAELERIVAAVVRMRNERRATGLRAARQARTSTHREEH